jgi:hypothetical protein
MSRRFIIKVKDRLERFLPAVFSLELPQQGIFPSADGDGVEGFYLFPAPTRSVPSGLAAVYAHLVKPNTREPVPHAILEVESEGGTRYGVADEQGRAVVLFPYPAFSVDLDNPDVDAIPLHEQEWDLTIRVRYSPDDVEFPLGTDTVPDIVSVFGQSAGEIWSSASESAAELPAKLQFDRAVVLRTSGRSELWIDAQT